MPRTPIDYSKSIIYKICCKDPEIKDIYIGSTTNFTKRKSRHKQSCININTKVYNFIRNNGNWENWDMVMIEEYKDCESKIQLLKKERFYTDELKATLNMYNAISNVEEKRQKNREYNIKHKDRLKELKKKYNLENRNKVFIQRKAYREKHREQIQKKQKIKMNCICGCSFNKKSKSRHEKTKKHIQYLETQN